MTRLLWLLLTLLFSLSGPAMGGYSDFWRSSFAAKTTGALVKQINLNGRLEALGLGNNAGSVP